MKNFTLALSILVIIGISGYTSGVFAQTSIYKLSVPQQSQMAQQIIEGEVIASQSFWDDDHNNIYTRHTIKVYKVFKGSLDTTIDIIVPGGVVDLEAEKVSHTINARPGDLGIFILRDLQDRNISKTSEIKQYESVGGDQSYFRYDISNGLAANPYLQFTSINSEIYPELTEKSKLGEPIILSDIKTTNTNNTDTRRVVEVVRQVSSFSATDYSGGTKSVLTVTGEGFGNEKGTVAFSNSDYGGYLKSDVLASQILNWSDSQIMVEIPEFAGSGNFEVKTSTGEIIESVQPININYAQTNMEYDLGSGSTAYNTRHIGDNGNGGYTFTMNKNFANSGAKEAFTRAFENWSCHSGINWEIENATTENNLDKEDGINLITFDETNMLPAGKLAQCKSRYKGCYGDGELKWYVFEIDIVFNDRSDWHTNTTNPTSSVIDLESVALHELGHGHQLNHVINTSKVMHYAIAAGNMRREIDSHGLMGAQDVQERSTTVPVCGQLTMTDVSCSTLGVDTLTFDKDISFYPNPANSVVTINNRSNANIEMVDLYAINGSRVKRIQTNGNISIKLEVSSLSQGFYTMQIQTDQGNIIRKLVIN